MLGRGAGCAKNHRLGKEEVEQARDGERHKVADHHIPPEDALEEEQKGHLDHKSRYGREVETHKVSPKCAPSSTVYAATPNPKIRPEEVAHRGHLERDEWRDDVGRKIASAKYKVGTYPQRNGIDHSAYGTARNEFYVFA